MFNINRDRSWLHTRFDVVDLIDLWFEGILASGIALISVWIVELSRDALLAFFLAGHALHGELLVLV